MRPEDHEASMRLLERDAGVRVASSTEFDDGAVHADTLADSEAVYFNQLGVAVVNAAPDQVHAMTLSAEEDDGILAVEPERIVYALSDEPIRLPYLPPDPVAPRPPEPPGPRLEDILVPAGSGEDLQGYLRGYRDAVNHLVDAILGRGASSSAEAIPVTLADESMITWGLQITNVALSHYTGKGVRVVVLDTGVDLSHPDFVGRGIVAQSFVKGEDATDGHGHGTHCIGTACGPRKPAQLPRYGIAGEADIYAGKVLNNQGSGTDANILAGINWALTNTCAVISMSLGAPVQVGQTYSQVYEAVARRALAAGTLIVAAAGNESERPGTIAPVGHPANCPSVIAVGALDSKLGVAWFSSGGRNPQGGQVDIAAPGVNIRSAWIQPKGYNTISGTSMATPHVAGIAALYAEAEPAMRGAPLAWLLLQYARRLSLPARDAGVGLVQAPV
jgi:subtilisin family serine protease